MSTTVTGKINEAAKEFENGSGSNFLVKFGVQEYQHKTKEKVWANYSAFVFVSHESQINFYRGALIANAIVEVTCTGLIPDVYGDNNRVTLEMQNASIGYVGTPASGQSSSAPQAEAPAPQPLAPPSSVTSAPPVDEAKGKAALAMYRNMTPDDQKASWVSFSPECQKYIIDNIDLPF